jgi:hypothetical protein
MAAHNDLSSMSVEAIDEYLTIAEHCISTQKKDGGIYGYPAILLLFCIIDALGNYVGHAKNTLRGSCLVVPGVTQEQIKHLKNWYRNLPAHQAIIMPGTQLSPDPAGAPIEFNSNGEPTHIRVIPFCRAVRSAWETFDRKAISPKFEQNQAPKTPFATTASSLPGVSGCYVTTSKS